MGLSSEQIAGPRPSYYSYEFLTWRDRIRAYWLGKLSEAAKVRPETYYIDSELGDDGNDGSEANPWKTLEKVHDTIAAGSGDQRFRFRRGRTWVGRGKNGIWFGGDGNHYSAVRVNKPGVVIDTYGEPLDTPPIFRVSPGLGSSWNVNTNSYYCDVTGLDPIHMVYETDWRTTPFTRQTSLVNCEATERSFFYDAENDRVYVHYDGAAEPPSDLYAIEGNAVSCFRLDNADGIVLDLGGADLYGYGYHATSTNEHNYAVSLGIGGTEGVLAANYNSYYTSEHTTANWNPAGLGESGGYPAWVNVGGGRGHSERLINYWQPGGGMDGYIYGCRPTAPSASGTWFRVVDGHTASGSTPHTYLIVDTCDGAFGCQQLPAGVVYNCRIGRADDRSRSREFGWSHAIINSELYYDGASPINFASSPLMLNCIIDYDCTITSDTGSGMGLWLNTIPRANLTGTLDHCLVKLTNRNGATWRGVGLSGDCIQSSQTAPSGMTVRRTIFAGQTDHTSYRCAPGVGDSADVLQNCVYVGMSKTTGRPNAGYSNVPDPIEAAFVPYLGSDAGLYPVQIPPEALGEFTTVLEYDKDGRRRNPNVNTAGPWELMPEPDRPTLDDLNGLLRAKQSGTAATRPDAYDKLRRSILSRG